MGRSPPSVLAPPRRAARPRRHNHRVLRAFSLLLVVCFALNSRTVAAFGAPKGGDAREVEIHTQQFSFSHGVKPAVAIAIEGTEISGSQIHRARATGQPKPKPSAANKPPPAVQPLPPTKPSPKKTRRETSALWPYELTEELTHQELMMILVATVSGLGLLGLVATALWYLVRFTWLTMREQKLLAALFRRAATASELERLVEKNAHAMPLALKPLAASHVRVVRFLETVDKLLATTAEITFNEVTLVLQGLPPMPPSDEDTRVASEQPMTLFHILSTIESLQCLGESIAVELTALVVPLHWKRAMDMASSVDELKKRMLALRQRHAEIQELHQHVVDALERRHVDGEAIDPAKLLQLVAALRQTPTQTKTPAADTMQLSSPLKLRNPRDGKDEFGFFLRSFEDLNKQREVQAELDVAFSKLTELRVTPLDVEVQIKQEEKVVEVTKEGKKWWGKTSHPTPPPAPPVPVTTTTTTTTTALTARLDANWTRTLEGWVDRADELEMTHLEEVKRAQYMLEEAKRESFCLMNSSRDAMQSVESLKASLVSLGADPKAAVLTAAEIYSSRSNMLMLTTTLRSVFDEFRKGDIIKMEDRRRRHAQKEKEKRERIVAKFRMKQHLLVEKMELQRTLEREQQERERQRREKEEYEAFVKQTKDNRKQFVWMISKLNVLIVLVVMAIVFFDSLTHQFDVLKPVCATATAPTASPSLLGFSSVISSSWWPMNSLSLLQCRLEYGLKITGLFLAGGVLFYIVAQLNLLATALPVVIAAGLYHVRTEWMNMVFRLPVLLVLYGFNSMVLYLLNQSLSEDDPKQSSKLKRRFLLLYVVFPTVSVLLSVVVSITIACDHPHECVVTAINVTQRSFASLWAIARHAYHL